MSNLIVIDHYRDPAEDLYRLTIGYTEERQVPVLDESGAPVFAPGESVMGDDGEEVVLQGEMLTESRAVNVPVEDFVFSAFDKRWEGKGEREVVAEQKRLVRAALRKRERNEEAAAAAAANLVHMPGVGEEL